MTGRPPRRTIAGRPVRAVAAVAVALGALAACGSSPPAPTRFVPGTDAAPRAVIVLLKDYLFLPPVIDLVPGETVVFQVVNGGLIVHEAVVGPMPVQEAWEAAEGPTVSAPPGPTAAVSVAPELAGLRVVAGSGQRLDVVWTVPEDATSTAGGWFIGCHIPGHWEKGMVIPIRLVGPDGKPLGSARR